jgi:hypothetical protein
MFDRLRLGIEGADMQSLVPGARIIAEEGGVTKVALARRTDRSVWEDLFAKTLPDHPTYRFALSRIALAPPDPAPGKAIEHARTALEALRRLHPATRATLEARLLAHGLALTMAQALKIDPEATGALEVLEGLAALAGYHHSFALLSRAQQGQRLPHAEADARAAAAPPVPLEFQDPRGIFR